MGMRLQVQKLVKASVKSLGDIALDDITYHYAGVMEYDPVSGGMIEVGGVDITLGSSLLDEPTSEEIADTPILMTDTKLIVPYLSITAEPRVDDYVHIDSVKYNIKWWNTDTTKSNYRIFVRKA